MNRQLMSVLFVFGAILAGCNSTPRVVPPASISNLPPHTLKLQWNRDLSIGKDDAVAQIYLRDDLIFVYTVKHYSYVLKRNGGELLFINNIGDPNVALHPPVLLSDRIVYPSETVFHIYNNRGLRLETLDLNIPVRSDVVAGADRTFYFGGYVSHQNRLIAVDLNRPYTRIKWQLQTEGTVSAAPTLINGLIYAGAEDGKVYAMNAQRSAIWSLTYGASNVSTLVEDDSAAEREAAESGPALKESNAADKLFYVPPKNNKKVDVRIPTFNTDGPIRADLKGDELGIYVPSVDTRLYCVDRISGKLKWQYFASQPLTTSPSVTSTTVYQLVPTKGIVAIDKLNGEAKRTPLWNVDIATQFLSDDATFAYLRSADNTILAVDKLTGQIKFTSKRFKFDTFATNTKDSTIYAATKAGWMVSIVPVLKPGTTGEMVLNFRSSPLFAFGGN